MSVMWGVPAVAAVTAAAVGGFIYVTRPVYCKSRASLRGKTVIVTGANTGIGKETALDLAQRGARVICACRDKARGTQAVEEIREQCGHNNVVYEHLDLADLDSVRMFADRIIKQEPKLHILINNAGLGSYGMKHKTTKQGFDYVFGVNHLGHFLLTYLLLDLLKMSAPSRIINVSSLAHIACRFKHSLGKVDGGYPDLSEYPASKAANILHARELTRRLEGTGVTANSLHPGFVTSDIWRLYFQSCVVKYVMSAAWYLLMIDCKDGAQTSIHCAVDESLETVSGKYFSNCAAAKESALARNDEYARKLWEASMELCGLDQ